MDSMGPNSDGFDPEACDTVLVDGCTFNSGDDCIAIKAGKNLDTQFGPTQNVVIQNCIMNSGHGGVTLGSEMSGGIQHVYAQNIEFRNANWATDPLNTAIRMKTNMNRGGFLRHFYVRNVTMPNGVNLKPGYYKPLPGSPIPQKSVGSSSGAVVTIDCDYDPNADNVRIRPPIVENIHISGVKVGNVATKDGPRSCYQALLLLGPVAFDYNGEKPAEILPIRDVTITDCDFGTPVNAAQPWFIYNVKNVRLTNVKIAGKVHNTTLST
jgi:polygalacturonase